MKTSIPLVDLRPQYEALQGEIDAAMAAVIRDCAFIQGPYVKRFEEAFAARLGAAHCLGCSNGTAALTLALDAVGVKPGDDVITVSQTFFATAEAILSVGARPIFVDIDPATHAMDPALVAAAVTPRTTAIVPVHLYGNVCDMDGIMAVAQRHGLKVVEDTAQAHLATYHGRHAGTIGDAGTFSFYPGKNLGAYGDAGAVVTNNPEVAARIRSMRDHGRTGKYEHDLVGGNHRMDGLQGAILEVKLRHLDQWTAARRHLARLYHERLATLGVSVAQAPMGAEPVDELLCCGVGDRGLVLQSLQAEGIGAGIHYPIPCHRQPALREFAGTALPVSERVAGRVISLPIYPELSEDQVDRICQGLGNALVA